MKLKVLFLAVLATFYACNKHGGNTSESGVDKIQRETDFNFDWKFKLTQDTLKPATVPLADADWRDIRLPHDFGIEQSFDSIYDGATGYLPGGVGVYQKHFKTPAKQSKKNIYILFDGVYNNATFWLNGQKLGENPYGYSPVYWDLTKILKQDGSDNILTVHVDHSRYVDSRWYTGGGIYRNVKLITVDKLHIPIWGTFITTPEVSAENATIDLKVKVANQYAVKAEFTLRTAIYDNTGTLVTERLDNHALEAGAEIQFTQNFAVTNPKLWGVVTPNMYKAVTNVLRDNKVIDTYVTPFGIRKLEFKVGEGFFLNGENTLIKGVCIHHDGGLVGTAVPKGVWRRRLQLLKDAGVNGIRTSHNPFSEEFMNLCDEMGMLVQDEIFDEFDYAKDKRQNYHDRHDDYISRGYDGHFQEWAKSDLTRSVLRDRNHPSVIQWSIGNEIEWTYLHYRYVTGFWKDPNNPQAPGAYWNSTEPIYTPKELKERYEASEKKEHVLAETAKKINGWVKELDPSRTTCANLIIPQVSHVSGYADAVDIAGYSYRNSEIKWAQKHFPHKQITITECPGNINDWNTVLENPGVYSMYMWTGIGYIGERHGDWPNKSGWSDILNIAGFKVQGWNYFKSIWVDEPHISFGTVLLDELGIDKKGITGQVLPEDFIPGNWKDSNMHWNYKNSEQVVVEVNTNLEELELFLNGKSLGKRELKDAVDKILRWVVPFEAGELKAIGMVEGKEVINVLETSTKPAAIKVTADKTELEADGYDVSHLIVQIVDDRGRSVKVEDARVTFEIEGEARLLGVDNGEDDNIQDFQSNTLVTAKGRCLAIVQSTRNKGTINVTVIAEGYKAQKVQIKTN